MYESEFTPKPRNGIALRAKSDEPRDYPSVRENLPRESSRVPFAPRHGAQERAGRTPARPYVTVQSS
ncbi:unnamed protein product, partial [Iphiclides podalirius]